MADAITRYTPKNEHGCTQHQTMKPAQFHPRVQYNTDLLDVRQLVERFDAMPKGFLANSAGHGAAARPRVNVKTVYDRSRKADWMTVSLEAVPFLKAARDIKQGEEILTHYGSTEETSSFDMEITDEKNDEAAAAGDVSPQRHRAVACEVCLQHCGIANKNQESLTILLGSFVCSVVLSM